MTKIVQQTQALETISMKWLEMIELRSVDGNRELLKSHLQQLIHQVDKEANTPAIKVYYRVMLETDVSIHLVHDSEDVEKSGGPLSPLGVRLASALKEFGLVNHRVWIEMYTT
jgi:hypothetical protein